MVRRGQCLYVAPRFHVALSSTDKNYVLLQPLVNEQVLTAAGNYQQNLAKAKAAADAALAAGFFKTIANLREWLGSRLT